MYIGGKITLGRGGLGLALNVNIQIGVFLLFSLFQQFKSSSFEETGSDTMSFTNESHD